MTLCCFCWHAFQEKGPDLGVPEWDRPLPRMAESLSLFIGLGVWLVTPADEAEALCMANPN